MYLKEKHDIQCEYVRPQCVHFRVPGGNFRYTEHYIDISSTYNSTLWAGGMPPHTSDCMWRRVVSTLSDRCRTLPVIASSVAEEDGDDHDSCCRDVRGFEGESVEDDEEEEDEEDEEDEEEEEEEDLPVTPLFLGETSSADARASAPSVAPHRPRCISSRHCT